MKSHYEIRFDTGNGMPLVLHLSRRLLRPAPLLELLNISSHPWPIPLVISM